MGSLAIGLLMFGSIFGGALLGLFVRTRLPSHHLTGESKDVVKLGMGLVGTMSALLLGLLVGSAKSSYDAQTAQLTQLSANIALLDRSMALYGPDSKAARDALRATVVRLLDQMWSSDETRTSRLAPPTVGAQSVYATIQELSPQTDQQRMLKGQALGIATEIGKTRWLMYEQATVTVSRPLLVALALWLSVSFMSFGLFAPFNATVVGSLLVAALSVASAVFLIMEMYSPYAGYLQISRAPLQSVLSHLGQ
jgi:hypothetical protein